MGRRAVACPSGGFRGDGPFGNDSVVWLRIREKMHCQALSLESRTLETLVPWGLIADHFEPSRHPLAQGTGVCARGDKFPSSKRDVSGIGILTGPPGFGLSGCARIVSGSTMTGKAL